MRVVIALALLVALLPAQSAGAEDKERSTLTIWSETLRYGTDPEILDALGRIQEAKELSLAGDLVRLLGQSRNDDVRSRILGFLAEAGEKGGARAALDLLALRDEISPQLSRAAMSYLSRIGDADAYADLKELALSRDESVAIAAIAAIGTIGAPGSAAELIEQFNREEVSQGLKNQIILSLGDLAATEAVELLVDIAGDREEERVTRMYACASLGSIGDTRATDVLTAALSEGDALLRTYAAAALGKLRAPGVAAALTQVLRDSSWQVRLEAARAIADGAAEADVNDDLVGMLSYRARRDEVSQVRRESMRALGTLGLPACFDLLRELYVDSKQPLDIRMAALGELVKGDLAGSMGSIATVVDQEWTARPERQKTLEGTALELSKAVSSALAELYGRFLGSTNLAVRVSGIRGVARNGLSEFAEKLQATAGDASPVIRREALAAMEKMGIKAAGAPGGTSASPGTR